jgi:hypothetical protein
MYSVITFLLRIPDIRGSSLGSKTAYPDSDFRDFSQSVQENAGIRLGRFLHHPLQFIFNLSIDATQILTALLTKPMKT